MHFDKNPFPWQCKKEDKKAYRFQISHFYGAFSNHIMAVKEYKISQYADDTEIMLEGDKNSFEETVKDY